MVRTADHPLCLSVGILVVAAELSGAGDIHQFADDTGWARITGGDIEDRKIVRDRTQRVFRGIRCSSDRHPALGGAEPVDDGDAEPFGEATQIPRCALVAVHDPQRIVGIVFPGRCGQDVGHRLSDVVGVGGAEPADVTDELRRGELAPQRNRRSRRDRRCPARHHGIGVEQWHRQVAGVRVPQPETVCQHHPGPGHLLVRAADRFGVTAGAGGEDQHEQIVECAVGERDR